MPNGSRPSSLSGPCPLHQWPSLVPLLAIGMLITPATCPVWVPDSHIQYPFTFTCTSNTHLKLAHLRTEPSISPYPAFMPPPECTTPHFPHLSKWNLHSSRPSDQKFGVLLLHISPCVPPVQSLPFMLMPSFLGHITRVLHLDFCNGVQHPFHPRPFHSPPRSQSNYVIVFFKASSLTSHIT